MVTDAILDFLFGVCEFGFHLLPSGDSLVVPGSPSWSVLSAANTVLPIDYFLTAMGFTFAFMVTGLAFWAVWKIINVVRGSGA